MMIGSYIARGLLLVFGYAYPAYECYKTVEMNRPDINDLRFWCQYWILVAGLTVLERIGDMFISWVPMYGEAKVAFFIYLWFPKTKGTAYVYDSFFRPYLARHETDIDRNLLELRTRVGDMVISYWQKVAAYGHTRVYDILQYIASQSTTSQAQARKQGTKARNPTQSKEQPASNTSNSSSTSQQEESSANPKPEVSQHEHKTTPSPAIEETSKVLASSDEQTMQIDSESTVAVDKPHSTEEIILEEPIPGQPKLRQRRSNSSR